MKVTWIAIFANLVSSQTFNGLPSCATSCLTNYESSSSIAGCNSIDIACICSNTSFLSGIACCLAAQCSAADQQAAVTYALNLCKANQVTNLPTAVSCTSTATSGSTGSAATQATTTSPSSSGSTATSKGSTSAASVTSHASSSTTSSNAAAATQTTNAAPQIIPGAGAGILGGLAAVAAFL
ncbi:uncharacterized protein PAC_00563 [Phialocephala subalpina]|uniref:CFEM domain-containing protein n=1 Tax=Phialocephala subalpina TaxID=576137 RepID=A0A1L7WDA7_9HELO|nr:uncharacterized protein PAC_00563 [Phialocephala subalpina]